MRRSTTTAANRTRRRARPGLILLDLNLPLLNGRGVLAAVNSEGLRTIPVIVLTTSSAEEDILRSYDLHANAYVTKPVDLTRFMEIIRLYRPTLPPLRVFGAALA